MNKPGAGEEKSPEWASKPRKYLRILQLRPPRHSARSQPARLNRRLKSHRQDPRIKNHRQGIAGGFGGLAKSRPGLPKNSKSPNHLVDLTRKHYMIFLVK
jgi:hypothetical protein